MLNLIYWVIAIVVAIAVISVALVVKYILYGIGLMLCIVILAGIIATGLKQHYQNKKPLD